MIKLFVRKIMSRFASIGAFNFLSDKNYLQLVYWAKVGKKLNLTSPATFTEKLQWLKLYNRNPSFTSLADKVSVRDFIANTIGDEYLIPLLGVWDKSDDINFDDLPSQFVLKCNHNSGLGMFICKDKSSININQVRRNLNLGLSQNYYLTCREWPYKDIKRKVVAEKFMSNDDGSDIVDYKIFCFNGIPKIICVNEDRFSSLGPTSDFFDSTWKHLNNMSVLGFRNAICEPKKPKNLSKMLELAKALANDIPFVRIDFYEISGNIYFGEITFFPNAGFICFIPEKWDNILGGWINLNL